MTYQALQINKDDTGYRCTLQALDDSALPEGDVTVQVDYSTVNYKDGLAITGKSPVVRKFPLTPGIDLSGTVTESQHPLFKVGDQVVLNGWGVGETHWGCLAQRAVLKGDWLVPLPQALTPRQAMAIGTAGYTAMLCVMALERHGVQPGAGEVLVTGATGGVGSVAVALLARLGHQVVAATGKASEAEYLKTLGAAELMRAKVGRIMGPSVGLMMVMKGLALTYSKDMQEDKEQVFDAADSLMLALAAMTGMVRDMQANRDALAAAAGAGFSTATDLADWLVRRLGLPFREAHHVTGTLVRAAEAQGCDLPELPLAAMQAVHPAITAEVFSVLGVENSVRSRISYGGTAPERVREQIARWREALE